MIGSLGEIVFEVHVGRVMTHTEVSDSVSARIGTHEIGGGEYPISEFIGKGLRTRSFTITLNAALGVDVQREIARARDYCWQGKERPLTMGGVIVGDPGALWMVEQVDVVEREHNKIGVCILADLALSLRLSTLPLPPMSVSPGGSVRLVPMNGGKVVR